MGRGSQGKKWSFKVFGDQEEITPSDIKNYPGGGFAATFRQVVGKKVGCRGSKRDFKEAESQFVLQGSAALKSYNPIADDGVNTGIEPNMSLIQSSVQVRPNGGKLLGKRRLEELGGKNNGNPVAKRKLGYEDIVGMTLDQFASLRGGGADIGLDNLGCSSCDLSLEQWISEVLSLDT